MTDESARVPEELLLEVLYFAGGIKSKIYGATARPEWVPPPEQVGLQNDVYLAPEQFAIDFSRFRFADDVVRPGAAHWFGVYGYAKDLYGDRGNFCGVGLWVPGVRLPDTEGLYDMLLKLVGMLQKSGLTETGPSSEFDEIADRALKFAYGFENWVGLAGPSNAAELGSTYGARATYVVLEEPFGPGTGLSADLVLAIDALFSSPVGRVTPRVLFLPPTEIVFDSRISSERIRHGVQRLLDGSPKSVLVRSLLDVRSELDRELGSSHNALRLAESNAALFDEDAKQARKELELVTARLAELKSTLLLPPMPKEEFFEKLEDILRENVNRLSRAGSAKQPSLQMEDGNTKVATELRAIKQQLSSLLQVNSKHVVPISWTQPEAPLRPAAFSNTRELPPWWMLAAGAAGLIVFGVGLWFALR